MRDTIVTTTTVGKTYVSRGTQIHALNNVNLTIDKGEIFGFLGPNGAGKTTLTKILVTLLKKSTGDAFVSQYNVDRDAHHIREIVGYQGQDTERSGYLRFTARENLKLFGRLRGIPKKKVTERIEELKTIGNFDFLDKYFVALSIGQRQTTIVMRAFLDEKAEIVFLDEPTRGLDPITALQLRTFIQTYVQEEGGTIVLVSHDMYEVESLCDRIALFNKGRIINQGTPTDIKKVLPSFYKITVTFPSPDTSLIEELELLPYVRDLTNSKRLEIIIENVHHVPGILQIMKKYNVEEYIEIKKPTLEDAFIQIVGGDNHD